MRARNKFRLTQLHIKNIKPAAKRQLFWDTDVLGLVLAVEPSGSKRFKYFYTFEGRSRWYTMGRGIGLADAKIIGKATKRKGHVCRHDCEQN